jgi:hypothetical protein
VPPAAPLIPCRYLSLEPRLASILDDLERLAGLGDDGRDAVDLLGVKNRVRAMNQAGAMLVVAVLGAGASGFYLPELDAVSVLALPDVPVLLEGLLERTEPRVGVAVLHRGDEKA